MDPPAHSIGSRNALSRLKAPKSGLIFPDQALQAERMMGLHPASNTNVASFWAQPLQNPLPRRDNPLASPDPQGLLLFGAPAPSGPAPQVQWRSGLGRGALKKEVARLGCFV